jgi:hypothetical protein
VSGSRGYQAHAIGKALCALRAGTCTVWTRPEPGVVTVTL